MKWATRENTEIGDTVLVPIHGEMWHDEQICLEYEVVVALRTKIKPDGQIVGEGQEPLPEYLPFVDGMALVKE